ncbi:hypothetical protein KC19_VG336800 [Ceratodon purpureus]|uniref:Uncharacterized protein n=1 Tax=Ceratodon purpureus TaxID=3225 RepID=A0A8T0HW91_CERPU|nr:hypothetical protein KC19_VG336800 [Ceratodon purpureus]
MPTRSHTYTNGLSATKSSPPPPSPSHPPDEKPSHVPASTKRNPTDEHPHITSPPPYRAPNSRTTFPLTNSPSRPALPPLPPLSTTTTPHNTPSRTKLKLARAPCTEPELAQENKHHGPYT